MGNIISTYAYDGKADRTQTALTDGGMKTYTYNIANILNTNETVVEVQNTTNYTYDKLNRIATVSGTKGADSYYEYDSRGNRKANFEQIDFLTEEAAEFRYNELDKLYYAEVGDNTVNIDYSENGYRYVKKENTDMPEYYVYDTNGRLMSEAKLIYMTISGQQQVVMYPVRQYIWGPDRVLAQINAITGNSYYYLYNGHGDVVQITDTTGTIVNSYDYDVWGNFLKKDETIDNPFTYFGQTYDEVTGLYYLRARYYDTTTGRFTGQDPAEDGYNWYVYGNNNPVRFIDPSGEGAGSILGGAWSLGGGAAAVDGPLPYGDIIGLGIGIGGTIIAGGVWVYDKAQNVYYAKKSKSSDKEKANDIPSWAKGEKPKAGESGKDYAKRLCDKKYGKDNYSKGPSSDYNKLKKYGDRGGK